MGENEVGGEGGGGGGDDEGEEDDEAAKGACDADVVLWRGHDWIYD